jgi:hypothetical protein
MSDWWRTSDNDTVATSPELWRPLDRHLGGFDLDPAAGCEPTPIAETRYTPADDGLSSPWFGTVWLNPPFSEKAAWYERLATQYRAGNVTRAAVVAGADPSTDWFHDHFTTADVILFLNGRDWFIGHGDSPSFATMIGLWNPTPDAIEWAETMGTVVTVASDSENAVLSEWLG